MRAMKDLKCFNSILEFKANSDKNIRGLSKSKFHLFFSTKFSPLEICTYFDLKLKHLQPL